MLDFGRVWVLGMAMLTLQAMVLHAVEGPDNSPEDDMVVKRLHITGPQNEPAEIVLGTGGQAYSIGATADGNFAITQGGKPLISTDADGNMYARAESFVASSVAVNDYITVGSVPQWALVSSAEFVKDGATGWNQECDPTLLVNGLPCTCIKDDPDRLGVTACGGVRMLGGYRRFASGHIQKSFTGLRGHTQLRFQGTLHFIDNWEGDTLFIMVRSAKKSAKSGSGAAPSWEYVWTRSHDSRVTHRAPSICGTDTPESLFAVPFDVTVPHTGDTVQIIVGSTLAAGMEGAFDTQVEGFWGISALNVYVRREGLGTLSLDSLAAKQKVH